MQLRVQSAVQIAVERCGFDRFALGICGNVFAGILRAVLELMAKLHRPRSQGSKHNDQYYGR